MDKKLAIYVIPFFGLLLYDKVVDIWPHLLLILFGFLLGRLAWKNRE